MIRSAEAADLDVARDLLREYAAWVGDEICFSSFEKELAELTGCYAPPDGRLRAHHGRSEEGRIRASSADTLPRMGDILKLCGAGLPARRRVSTRRVKVVESGYQLTEAVR